MPCFTCLLRYFERFIPYFLVLLLGSCQSNPPQNDDDPAPEDNSGSARGIVTVPIPSMDFDSPVAITEDHEIQKRYALVIGNSKYDGRYWPQLSNPVNDAKGVKEALESLPKGKRFEVFYLEDATYPKMEETTKKFVKKLNSGGVGLFFYAGHGTQIADNGVEGVNYLIPIDLHSNEETDVKHKSLSANYVLDMMEEAENDVNIIILDACRVNELAKGKTRSSSGGGSGLATMRESEGALIAFSTTANTTAEDGSGKNSPYAKYLIEGIKLENMAIENMFRWVRTKVKEETNGVQSPTESTKLEGSDFCFVSCRGEETVAENERLKKENERVRQQAEQERQARVEAERQQGITEQQRKREEEQRIADEKQAEKEERERVKKEQEERIAEEERRKRAGTKIDQEYYNSLETSALLSDAKTAYEKEDYEKVLAIYSKAAERKDGQSMDTYMGLYNAAQELRHSDVQEEAYARLVEIAVANNSLSSRFLFEVNKTEFKSEKKDEYELWLRKIAEYFSENDKCLNIVGHSSKTGDPEYNVKLSRERAQAIRTAMSQESSQINQKSKALGEGFGQCKVCSGSDDTKDAVDRRVEFTVIDCSEI